MFQKWMYLNKLKINSFNLSRKKLNFLENFNFVFIEKLFRIVLSIIVVSKVSKFLGPENFGTLSLIESFYSILIALSALGIDSVIIKEFKENNYEKNVVAGSSFIIKLCSSLLISVIAISLSFFTDNSELKFGILVISLSIIFTPFNVIDYYYQSKLDLKKVSTVRSLVFVFSSLLKLTIVYFNIPWKYLFLTILIEQFLVSFLYYKIKPFGFNFKTFNLSRKLLNYFFKSSIFLFITSFSLILYSRIDQIMIKFLLTDYDLGNYSASMKIVETLYIFPTIFLSSIFPIMIEKSKEGDKLFFVKLYRFFFFFSLIISACVFLFSDLITSFIYGTEFSSTSQILKLNVIAVFFYSYKLISVQIIYVNSFYKSLLIQTISSIAINIILNYILIIKFGVFGAIYSTLISLFYSVFVYEFFDCNLRKYYRFKFLAFNGNS